jgi:hypothetical protein
VSILHRLRRGYQSQSISRLHLQGRSYWGLHVEPTRLNFLITIVYNLHYIFISLPLTNPLNASFIHIKRFIITQNRSSGSSAVNFLGQRVHRIWIQTQNFQVKLTSTDLFFFSILKFLLILLNKWAWFWISSQKLTQIDEGAQTHLYTQQPENLRIVGFQTNSKQLQ